METTTTTETKTHGTAMVRTTTQTDEFSFGPLTTVTVEMKSTTQTDWVFMFRRAVN